MDRQEYRVFLGHYFRFLLLPIQAEVKRYGMKKNWKGRKKEQERKIVNGLSSLIPVLGTKGRKNQIDITTM